MSDLTSSQLILVYELSVRLKLRIETDLRKEIRRARLRLFGHVMRLNNGTMLKLNARGAMDRRVYGKAGWPKASGTTCVRQDFQSRGIERFYAFNLAKQREKNILIID
eukprot:CAMPEP_0197855702 /NCGR_PEP_ID=MMETSP1438-20131217/27098_1 /TAXON_ID=1461541 /ORGANISM="Pterosperma sp., Strain CCMP1384" /LENGTH=107 /DNA_ID=CAMNT_0043470903 /DNA_START=237 /DNA_END=560 /DNA_ORIENTATION=-